MLEHIIDNFTYFNFKKFHLVLNHQAELIKSYFRSKKNNFRLNYVKEPKTLGTAGGIYFIKKFTQMILSLRIVILYLKLIIINFDNHKK